MPTMDDCLARPVGVRLGRVRSTPGERARRLEGHDAAALARRPDAGGWSAGEIVCHLRDVEELFLVRFQTILAADDPQILTLGASPEALAAWGIGGEIAHPPAPSLSAQAPQGSRRAASWARPALPPPLRAGAGTVGALPSPPRHP